MKLGIIIVGYNRLNAIERLIRSVSEAEFLGDNVDLVISLDKSDNEAEMIRIAETVNWAHGEKIIRTFPRRQGLKAHILQCGDLTEKYDAVIVLEDDLVVSKGFYTYVKQCLEYYREDERIAGISLYSFQVAPGIFRPFQPSSSGHDVFLLRFAQSWGQCWTRRMWVNFKKWYSSQSGHLESDGVMPDYIASWDDKSWLKYYMKYTAENRLYFVYPYVSLTTNYSESGEHNTYSNANFQVPLLQGVMQYRFPTRDDEVRYDAFMERELADIPQLAGRVEIDLYGMKQNYEKSDYLISTKQLPYSVIDELGLSFRPHEENIIRWNKGRGIFVYDLRQPTKRIPHGHHSIALKYDLRAIGWRKSLRHGIQGVMETIRRKFH